jgi:hypothetical protein
MGGGQLIGAERMNGGWGTRTIAAELFVLVVKLFEAALIRIWDLG